jgi:membrane protease YdiL (CAAX protease family)
MAPLLRHLIRDKEFGLAISGALLFWAVVWLTLQRGSNAVSLSWPAVAPIDLIYLTLLAPILEEMAFRGMIQGFIYDKSRGRMALPLISAANLATSLLFAGWHLIGHSPAWAVSVLIPSLVFGYFRDKYRNLLPSTFLHIFYNAGYFLLFTRSP